LLSDCIFFIFKVNIFPFSNLIKSHISKDKLIPYKSKVIVSPFRASLLFFVIHSTKLFELTLHFPIFYKFFSKLISYFSGIPIYDALKVNIASKCVSMLSISSELLFPKVIPFIYGYFLFYIFIHSILLKPSFEFLTDKSPIVIIFLFPK
jgi:hypothetical protein